MEAGGWVSQFTSGMQQEILPKLTFDCRGANPNMYHLPIEILSLVCFKMVFFSNYLARRMRSYIGCICLIFSIVYVQMIFQTLCMNTWKITVVASVRLFSTMRFLNYVSSNYLHGWMHNCIPCICAAFFPYVLSCVSSNYLSKTMHSCIRYIYAVFLLCACSNVSSDYPRGCIFWC